MIVSKNSTPADLVDNTDDETLGLLHPAEQPPLFSQYDAQFFSLGNGDVVSHDPHLNTDGEALYRFLLSQADVVPTLQLHCRGAHQETRHRYVTERHSDGRTSSRRETYTETIVDFDFYIDLTQELNPKPTQWTVADPEPAYRGTMTRKTQSANAIGKSTNKLRKAYKKWAKERARRGLPPWAPLPSPNPEQPDDNTPLRSSKSVREWADQYCASQGYLKEFVYEKVIYGWNLQQLEFAIRASIAASLYRGDVTVDFETSASKVYIRPDNRLSRTLSNKWLKLLLIITLIYPFIWLFKRFHSKGGGRWAVCGGAYTFVSPVPIQTPSRQVLLPELVSEEVPPYSAVAEPTQVPSVASGSRGPLLDSMEAQWLRRWQPTIVRGVQSRYQSPEPLNHTINDRLQDASDSLNSVLQFA